MANNSRQLALIAPANDGDGACPLGSRRDFAQTLAGFNTASDGSTASADVFFGPGFHVELPRIADDDDVVQALVTVVEEDMAWPVLARICNATGWRLLDTETGRTFGG